MTAVPSAMQQPFSGGAAGFRTESARSEKLAHLHWAQSRRSLRIALMTELRTKLPFATLKKSLATGYLRQSLSVARASGSMSTHRPLRLTVHGSPQ